jgi:SAM-dependent methyltransferase
MSSTRESFNHIAPSWYRLRQRSRFASELARLAAKWQKGRLLNIGCAHGSDFLPFASGFKLYGLDFSREMIRLAQEHIAKNKLRAELVVADAAHLPFAARTFDWAISVATFHHLHYPQERRAAFHELWRVLKPGGEAFITVWNHWQPKFWLKGKEIVVPWHDRGTAWPRYYYLFSYRELESEARQSGFTVLASFPEESYRFRLKYFSRNICLLIRKENPEPPAASVAEEPVAKRQQDRVGVGEAEENVAKPGRRPQRAIRNRGYAGRQDASPEKEGGRGHHRSPRQHRRTV